MNCPKCNAYPNEHWDQIHTVGLKLRIQELEAALGKAAFALAFYSDYALYGDAAVKALAELRKVLGSQS
jgi:hypothetical protein